MEGMTRQESEFMAIPVWWIETEAGRYPAMNLFVDFEGASRCLVYVHPQLVVNELGRDVVIFPARARLNVAATGQWVIVPAQDRIVHAVRRGHSVIELREEIGTCE